MLKKQKSLLLIRTKVFIINKEKVLNVNTGKNAIC